MLKFLLLIPVLLVGLVACGGAKNSSGGNTNGKPLTVPDIGGTFTGTYQAKITNCPGAVNNPTPPAVEQGKKPVIISIPDGTIVYGGGTFDINQQEGSWSSIFRNPDDPKGQNFHSTVASFDDTGKQNNSGVHSYLNFNKAIIDKDGNFPAAQNIGVLEHTIFLIKTTNTIKGDRANIWGQAEGGKLTINFETPPNSTGCRITGTLTAYKVAPKFSDSLKNAICKNDPTTDSIRNGQTFTRIQSHTLGAPIYNSITSRSLANGTKTTIDYMVHRSTGTIPELKPDGSPVNPGPKGEPTTFLPITRALIVLLPGGNGDAKIAGTPNSAPSSSGGNFLIRSAHLFAAQGFDVVSINRPSDTIGITNGIAYDDYRNSMRHAVDISNIINTVNALKLPVFIAGTSRGAISALANNTLATAVMLSSPVTSGGGTPLDVVFPSANTILNKAKNPIQVTFHQNDACISSVPTDSFELSNKLLRDNISVKVNSISGGFDNPNFTECQAQKYHGFLGIEACATAQQASFAFNMLIEINRNPNNTIPVASAGVYNVPISAGNATPTTFELNNFNGLGSIALDADAGGILTYSVPYATTSLGGQVSITAAGSVSYTPPPAGAITANTQDSFVYVVNDPVGGASSIIRTATANNVVSINLLP